MFYSSWFLGQPVLVLPESISFDTGAAALVSVGVVMNPASNAVIEGISLSSIGLSLIFQHQRSPHAHLRHVGHRRDSRHQHVPVDLV